MPLMPAAATICKLEQAVGRVEACPEAGCPFWEPGRAAPGRCAVELVDLSGRTELASLLLQLRRQLEHAATADDEDRARRSFYDLLDTGDSDGG